MGTSNPIQRRSGGIAAWSVATATYEKIRKWIKRPHTSDFPKRVARDPRYVSPELPVTPEHLAAEGVSPKFVEYLRSFPGFVTDKPMPITHDAAMGMWMKTDG